MSFERKMNMGDFRVGNKVVLDHKTKKEEGGGVTLSNYVSPERLVFARNFSLARKNKKLSQSKIHQLTGFAQSWISEVETGKSTINIDNMARLADVVDQPLWKLLKPD